MSKQVFDPQIKKGWFDPQVAKGWFDDELLILDEDIIGYNQIWLMFGHKVISDPFWAQVSLLAVNDNATDTTTTFIDQSGSALTITATGNGKYDATSPPTGMTTSLKTVAGGTDGIFVTDAVGLQFGSGDFTVEFYLYVDALQNGKTLCNKSDAGGVVSGISLAYDLSGGMFFTAGLSAIGDVFNNVNFGTISATTWTHIAVTRSGSDFYGAVAGTVASIGSSSSALAANSGDPLYFNRNRFGGVCSAHTCSIRITKGAARYTSNFTPPSLPFING